MRRKAHASPPTYYRYVSARPEDLARLSITSVGHFLGKGNFRCSRLNGHHVQHLIYTLRGSAIGDLAGQRSRCDPGSLWFTRKDKPYEYWIDPDCQEWEGYWVEYDGAWAPQLWEMTGLSDVTHAPGCFEARPIVEAIHQGVLEGSAATNHESAALLWRLFAVAEANLAGARIRTDTAAAAVERVQRHVRERLGTHIGLRDLARIAGLSPFHFARVFHRRTGFTPAAYVRTVRIGKAQELLRRGELNVKQVGQEVGYPAVQHFSAVFKQATGLSPRAFVRQNQGIT